MKPITALIALSLVGNIALLVFAASRAGSSSRHQDGAPAGSGPATAEAVARAPQGTLSRQQPDAVVSASTEPAWQALWHSDRDVFRQRLQDAGYPPGFVRALLSGALEQEYRDKLAQLGENAVPPYWHAPWRSYLEKPSPRQKLLSEYWRANNRLSLDAALLESDSWELEAVRDRLGNLPLEKLKGLMVAEQDYNDQIRKISDAERKDPQQTQKAYFEAQEAQRRRIEELLSPEELREYDLRNSPTASRLRSAMGLLKGTEAEYLAAYEIERGWDDAARAAEREAHRTGSAYPAMPSRQEYDEKLKAALGPDRFTEYQILRENGNDQLTRLVARLELPLTTVKSVNMVREEMKDRARVIHENASLSPEQRSAQLRALGAEAKTALETRLGGPRGFNAYNQLKGEWLRALQAGKTASSP